MKNKKSKVLLFIGVIVFGFAAVFLVDHLRYVNTDNASIQAHALLLSPKVSGYLSEVVVKEGEIVKKDQLLSKMDARDFENTLNQLKSDKKSLEAKVLESSQNFIRSQELLKSGSVSKQQFDTARSVSVSDASKLESLNRQINQAELNLSYTEVHAPSDGKIAKKSAEVGQFVQAGTPLFGFVSSENRWVIANFKETDLDVIKVGAEAIIEVDAFSGKTFKGHVESISSATGSTFTLLPPDNATGNFTKVVQRIPVRISLEGLSKEELAELPSGLSALVKVRKK